MLFEVPGWSVPNALIKEQSIKKRKHLSPQYRGHVPTFPEKLSSSLPKVHPGVGDPGRCKKQKGQRSSVEQEGGTSLSPMPKRKRRKKQTSNHESPTRSDAAPLTALQRSMKGSLDGARFRLINETLYKSESHEAQGMMQQDPKIFEEYHIGFRHQVLSWPTNPVDHYISRFLHYTKKTIIADLGCGDAALAKRLLPKGFSVISFDLVSDNKFVVEADICERIPLPGSEGGSGKSTGEGQIVDVVVCALSLMGTNWVKGLREAWRILKSDGQLHIAEVTSRFTDIEQFVTLVGSIGFNLKARDDSNTHFMLFEFAKAAQLAKSDKEWAKLVAKGNVLKPCEYKRR